MLYSDLSYQTVRPAEGFYTSEVESPRSWPVRTFLPTGYEPGYAYPLLVFFHGYGSDEKQILHMAPRLSRRNFICIGLRGSKNVGYRPDGEMGYSWGADDCFDVMLEEYVFQAIELTCQTYHIHTNRIYLAGFCEGVALAYRLGLTFPEKFAGIISLNGAMTRRGRPLLRLAEIRKLRVFIGHGIANALTPLSMAKNDQKLLYTAGMGVDFNTYLTNHRLHPDMLRDVNRWVIGHCNQDESH
jgi:phospholipase/carboxylesterase